MQFTTDSSSTAYPSPTSTPFSTEQAATIVKDMQYSSYGINAFALLVAVMGCVAVFTNKKIFAAIYTGLISCYVFVFCIIGVVIIVLLAGIGAAANTACDNAHDTHNDCKGTVNAALAAAGTMIMIVLACMACCYMSCCFCGAMYYKGLKDEENVTYVVGATNNISVNNQFSAGYAQPAPGYPQGYTQTTPTPQYGDKDAAAVPPVDRKSVV